MKYENYDVVYEAGDDDAVDEVGNDVDVNQAGEHVASKGKTFLPMERTLFHIDQVENIPK